MTMILDGPTGITFPNGEVETRANMWVLLDAKVASNSPNVVMTWDPTGFKAYRLIVGSFVFASTGEALLLETSTDSGVTFPIKTRWGFFKGVNTDSTITAGFETESSFSMRVLGASYTGVLNNAVGHAALDVHDEFFTFCTNRQFFTKSGTSNGTAVESTYIQGTPGNVAINSIKLNGLVGNLTSGTFRLYGIR